MANLCAGSCILWSIIAMAFAPPLSRMCFKCRRKWKHLKSPNELRQHRCSSCMQIHLAHMSPSTTIRFSPPGAWVRACVWIFLVTGMHPQWSVFLTQCVRAASCWRASQMVLNVASPGALQTVPSTAGRSRADLIVCTSECSPQHHRAASLHIIQGCNGE